MIDLHFYDVRGSLPKKGGLSYRKNCDEHVVAESAVMAIKLVMKAHPDATIHSVQHRGKIDIAQEIPSDANLTETYYCINPRCIACSSDGTIIRAKLGKGLNGLWRCPTCLDAYGNDHRPNKQKGA